MDAIEAPLRNARRRFRVEPQEFKAVAIRPIPIPEEQRVRDGPEGMAAYWEAAIASSAFFAAFRETCFAIALDVRHRIIGHYLVEMGTLNSVAIHARDVFRIAILVNAYSSILAYHLCVAAHKLCHVDRRVMCSRPLAASCSTRVHQRKEGHGTN